MKMRIPGLDGRSSPGPRKPSSSPRGARFLEELRRDEGGLAIPVIVVTAKDLSAERRRLNGQVERILAKGAYSREALLTELRALVAASVGRGRAKEPT